jgi:3-phenylpropionate/trans-cinnamate dioxygenase ferredoxin subunit
MTGSLRTWFNAAQMAEYTTLAKISDFESGAMQQFDVDGGSVVVARVDDEFYAFDSRCPHSYQPLMDGKVKGHSITCAYHSINFDMRTGKVNFGSSAPLMLYDVRVEGDEVQIGARRPWSPAAFVSRCPMSSHRLSAISH